MLVAAGDKCEGGRYGRPGRSDADGASSSPRDAPAISSLLRIVSGGCRLVSGVRSLGYHISRLHRSAGRPAPCVGRMRFIDPISDIAVFCEPDNQELPDQAQAYEALTEQATPFRIGKLRFSRQRLRPREVSITGMASGAASLDKGCRDRARLPATRACYHWRVSGSLVGSPAWAARYGSIKPPSR